MAQSVKQVNRAIKLNNAKQSKLTRELNSAKAKSKKLVSALKSARSAEAKAKAAKAARATKRKGKKSKKTGCAVSWMSEVRDTRNAVMHPSKRDICEEDIDSLRNANRIVRQFSANMQSLISKAGEA